jgi:hypothetical protein
MSFWVVAALAAVPVGWPLAIAAIPGKRPLQVTPIGQDRRREGAYIIGHLMPYNGSVKVAAALGVGTWAMRNSQNPPSTHFRE